MLYIHNPITISSCFRSIYYITKTLASGRKGIRSLSQRIAGQPVGSNSSELYFFKLLSHERLMNVNVCRGLACPPHLRAKGSAAMMDATGDRLYFRARLTHRSSRYRDFMMVARAHSKTARSKRPTTTHGADLRRGRLKKSTLVAEPNSVSYSHQDSPRIFLGTERLIAGLAFTTFRPIERP